MSVTKRIAKNFSWLMAGNLISGALNFAAVIYVARVLGATSFGLLYFAQAFLFYLLIFLDYGLAVFGVREIAKDQQRAAAITVNVLMLRLLVAAVIYLIALLVVLVVPIALEMRLLFAFTFLYVFYRALNSDWVFQGLEKMEFIAVSKVLIAVLTFTFIFIFIKNPNDLIVVPLVNFIFGVLGSLVFVGVLFSRFFSLKLSDLVPQTWWKYFMLSIPLTASALMTLIYNNLDAIMLGFMDTARVVGYYGSAYKILMIFSGAFAVWTTTVFPVSTKKMHESKISAQNFLEKYLKLTLLLVVPVVFGIFFSAPLIMVVIYGREYLTGVLALQIIIWSLLVLAAASTYGSQLLIPAGYFGQFFKAVMTGAVVNIILNFVLIPRYSFVGAAVATIAAEVMVLLMVMSFSRKVMVVSLLKNLVRPAVFSVLAGVGVWLFTKAVLLENMYLQSLGKTLIFVLLYGVAVLWFERAFIFDFVKETLRKG